MGEKMGKPVSTRAKGDAFERRVARALRGEIRAGRLNLAASLATLRTKPQYHSQDRGSPIQFDLSIEMRLNPKLPPSLTILVECKDYAGAIGVGEIEEFKAKLDQCFGKNVKGLFI